MAELNTSTTQQIDPAPVDQGQKELPIWMNHEFNATAYLTNKAYSRPFGNKEQKKLTQDRKAQTEEAQQEHQTFWEKIKTLPEKAKATWQKQMNSFKEQSDIKYDISDLDEATTGIGTLKHKLKNTHSTKKALGIIDGALRSEKASKPEILTLLFDVYQDKELYSESKDLIANYIEYMLTEDSNGWPEEIKDLAVSMIFDDNNKYTTIQENLLKKYDNNTSIPEPFLNTLTDVLCNIPQSDTVVETSDESEMETTITLSNFPKLTKQLKDGKQWATQVYANELNNNDSLRNELAEKLSNDNFQDKLQDYELKTFAYCLSKKEGWAQKIYGKDKEKYKDFVANAINSTNHEIQEGKLHKDATPALLSAIINSSEEDLDWGCDLLVKAANNARTTDITTDVQTTEEKIPNWLSEVMRGIKTEAFQKIAEHVITKQQSNQVEIITTLALAALPKDDNKINENCMPFTAFSGLLSIKNDTKGLNCADIVADIGQALIDADCNYKVGEEARWTNSRTKAFLKALNAIDSTDKQKGQEKSPSDLAKDALCLCRNHKKLEGNAYKFDVAIQHIADKACEKPDAASATDSKTTTPKPIISFLAECFVSANDAIKKDESPYHAIAKSMQDFKTDTETTLFQFKTATCEAIKDAMKSLLDVAKLSNDQLQYFKEIKENRYNELSDDKIVNKMNEILELAQAGSLETSLKDQANLFPSMYVLEHVCILLNDQKELEKILEHIKKFNNQTISTPIYSQHKQTALDIISKHYSLKETNQTQQSENQTSENSNTIREQFNDFRSKNKGQSLTEIEIRSHEGLKVIELNQAKDSPDAQIFTENRDLKGVSGYGNNCLFYAICGQKTEQNADKYNAYALRQKYVEIQKAGKDISPEDKQRLKEEQADISCLPQMATHLNRPIVVLTEKSDDGQGENGIRIALPGDTVIPISLGSLDKKLQEETGQNTFTNVQEEIKIAFKDKTDQKPEEMTVQYVLEQLLSNDKTIALHFKGDTKNGHYQPFVMKEKKGEVEKPAAIEADKKEQQVKEEEEDFGGFGDLF